MAHGPFTNISADTSSDGESTPWTLMAAAEFWLNVATIGPWIVSRTWSITVLSIETESLTGTHTPTFYTLTGDGSAGNYGQNDAQLQSLKADLNSSD